ncbi:hypothetical protein ABND68_13085, partial [Paenibacillus larvae]
STHYEHETMSGNGAVCLQRSVHAVRVDEPSKWIKGGSEEAEELSEVIEEGFNEIYFRIPQRESDEGYTDMVDFTETIEDKMLRSTLMHILSGDSLINCVLTMGALQVTRCVSLSYTVFTQRESRCEPYTLLSNVAVCFTIGS